MFVLGSLWGCCAFGASTPNRLMRRSMFIGRGLFPLLRPIPMKPRLWVQPTRRFTDNSSSDGEPEKAEAEREEIERAEAASEKQKAREQFKEFAANSPLTDILKIITTSAVPGRSASGFLSYLSGDKQKQFELLRLLVTRANSLAVLSAPTGERKHREPSALQLNFEGLEGLEAPVRTCAAHGAVLPWRWPHPCSYTRECRKQWKAR